MSFEYTFLYKSSTTTSIYRLITLFIVYVCDIIFYVVLHYVITGSNQQSSHYKGNKKTFTFLAREQKNRNQCHHETLSVSASPFLHRYLSDSLSASLITSHLLLSFSPLCLWCLLFLIFLVLIFAPTGNRWFLFQMKRQERLIPRFSTGLMQRSVRQNVGNE